MVFSIKEDYDFFDLSDEHDFVIMLNFECKFSLHNPLFKGMIQKFAVEEIMEIIQIICIAQRVAIFFSQPSFVNCAIRVKNSSARWP
jgi:hypothetical protein